MNHRSRLLSTWLCLGILIGGWVAAATSVPAPAPGVEVLGIDHFADSAAAAEAWKAQGAYDDQGALDAKRSTCPATVVPMGDRNVLELTCNFSGTTIPRTVWDRHVEQDFSLVTAIVFDVFAEDVKGIAYMHLYIGVGDGWYGAEWYPAREGEWCRVRIPKGAFKVDRYGGGWGQVNTIRISPWAAASRDDAVLRIANFAVEEGKGDLLIVKNEFTTVTAQNKSNAGQAGTFTSTLAGLLEAGGLTVPVVSSRDLGEDLLRNAAVVFLPFGSGMERETEDKLLAYLDRGGFILACFSLPERLSKALGVKRKGFRPRAYDGEFSSIRRAEGAPDGFPETIRQNSFAVADCEASPTGRVMAWWQDTEGKRTAPAFISSPRGSWFSHVLMRGDADAKTDGLVALVAEHYPEIREVRWQSRLARAGMQVNSLGWDPAIEGVSAMPGAARSERNKAEAQTMRAAAIALAAQGNFAEATPLLADAERALVEATCRAWKPVAKEFRATWCHPPQGIDGLTWEETAKRLAAAGIDHLFLNALNGAAAAYPSAVMPYWRENKPERDYLGEAINGCAKVGISVHVWICNYKLRLAPPSAVDKLRTAGRIAIKRDGSEGNALCPSHPSNTQLQAAAMLEAALRPGVAGVHFDYIRYGNSNTCFCTGCRTAFEKLVGEPLPEWPAEASPRGRWHSRWLQFRRDNISRLVKRVHQTVRTQAPACLISAAVFKNYPACRDDVGQDWPLWAREGWVDVVCPMDYTASDAQFGNLIRNQLDVLAGSVPCYPGIGLLKGMGPTGAARQIDISRKLGTGGFVIWSVYPEYIDTYRYLGMGILPGRK
ncbi:MAG: family 10 glycosylhydrolase [Lentisphaerae bacterium]|jgi:uncharacterized lipoprotein YddW (UPF0748 family)|nr:family 10 glycosylhydrolase [Lentisphaerota bacterium]MBT4819471.1 family 10 glycosylhydrolase [Lentisphaerota bacterium]MBT5611731.1 family 10 glycosylhydrolase [Lentisphaerota bacterium]MBT7060429.1 family 10 glycosylhydrolase [Lentisphaerota bacterium]MBT7848432.1 family 10 glycosylhydrolase [Lentisphaerota bacterium]